MRNLSVRQLRPLLALPFLALPWVAACGSEDVLVPVEGSPGNPNEPLKTDVQIKKTGVVEASPPVARDAVVTEGSITLPYQGNEGLLDTLKPGTVFYGDRAPGYAENNPLGFSMMVDSIAREGDFIVITGRPATIDELFDVLAFETPLQSPPDFKGSYDSGEGGELVEDGVTPQTLSPLDFDTGFNKRTQLSFDFGRMAKGETTNAEGSLAFSGGITVGFNPRGNIRYEKRYLGLGTPNVRIDLGLGIDFIFAVCAKAEGKLLAGKQKHDGLIAFDDKVSSKPLGEIKLPEVFIPVAGPVPVTVKAKPTLFCGVEYTRGLGVAYEYRNSWQFDTAFGIQSGSPFGNWKTGGTGGSHSWEFALQGGLKVRCGVQIKTGVYLFNALGAYILLAPGAELGVSGIVKVSGGTGKQTTATAQACAGADIVVDSKFGLEASIGWVDVNKEFPLGEPFRAPLPFPLRACASNEQPNDDCVGKEDGWYCSEINSAGSFKCAGGAKVGGNACPSNKYCATENNNIGDRAVLDGDSPGCLTAAPRPKEVTLSFCPAAPEPLTRE